jgi:hypothetical protein
MGYVGMVECNYCDNPVKRADLAEHEKTCEWHPERCSVCGQVIILRDLAVRLR